MVLSALLVTMLVGNWRDRLRRGAQGDLEAGRAIGLAIFAGVLAAILDADWLAWSAAGAAAAISLSVQSLAWAVPGRRTASRRRHRRPRHDTGCCRPLRHTAPRPPLAHRSPTRSRHRHAKSSRPPVRRRTPKSPWAFLSTNAIAAPSGHRPRPSRPSAPPSPADSGASSPSC